MLETGSIKLGMTLFDVFMYNQSSVISLCIKLPFHCCGKWGMFCQQQSIIIMPPPPPPHFNKTPLCSLILCNVICNFDTIWLLKTGVSPYEFVVDNFVVQTSHSFRIAQRRNATVARELNMETSPNKKLTRQEKDERFELVIYHYYYHNNFY